MQEFKPDLMLADFVLAGGIALADKLGIPKAVMVPFFGSGMMNNLFGSGASLLATVPQFSSRLPRHMVSNISSACVKRTFCPWTRKHVFP